MKVKIWVALTACLFVSAGLLESSAIHEGTDKTQSFPVAAGDTLQMRIDTGDIYINTWDRNEVQVKAEGVEEQDLRMSKSGKMVTVDYEPERHHRGEVRFYAQVPAATNLDLNTAGGDIQLKGGIKGTVTGRTSGGDIHLDDVVGKTDIATSGGDIHAGKITGEAELETSGGDIMIDSVSSQVRLRTSGGEIRIGDVGKTLDASTAGGDVVVGNVGGEATVSTAGGDIQMGKVSGSARVKTAGGDIVLRGASGRVTAETAGGDVKLEDVTGSVEAETAGGDVVAQLIPTGKGGSRLSTAGGDVQLSIPENAKASITARIRIRGRWHDEDQEYSIRSDFKSSTYQKDEDKKEIRATYELNGGGEPIDLETTNGDIVIMKLAR